MSSTEFFLQLQKYKIFLILKKIVKKAMPAICVGIAFLVLSGIIPLGTFRRSVRQRFFRGEFSGGNYSLDFSTASTSGSTPHCCWARRL